MIQFNSIPGNVRVPFMHLEINPGQAPYQSNARLILIGQKTAAGAASVDQPILVSRDENGLFGAGSQLAAMYKFARFLAPFQEIWCAPLGDAAGSTKATGSIVVQGAPVLAPGTVVVYIGDIRVAVPVSIAMGNLSIANALVAAIAACEGMQVTPSIQAVGAKATAAVTLAGPATAAGAATLTINGVDYTTLVASGDTAATVAANLAAAIAAKPGANVKASVTSDTVTLTSVDTGIAPHTYAKAFTSTGTGVTATFPAFTGGANTVVMLTANNAGTLGNTIGIETKLYPDDGALADILLAVTKMANGAGDPSFTNVLTNMGDQEFDWIVNPYSDTASLSLMDTFMDDRWGNMQQLYGHYVTARDGTAGALQAHVMPRNGWHGSIVAVRNFPAPTYLVAAGVGAHMAVHLQSASELSRPLQTLPLVGLRGPKKMSDRFTMSERQSFYYSGISGLRNERDNSVSIERIVSMYKRDAWGSNDMTWLDVNTQAQIMYGVRFIKQKLTSTYPRAALVDDNPNNIQGFATADDLRNVTVHAYRELCNLGVFENPDMFEELLIVERNASDPNRVDFYIPVDHVNQLRILAANVTSYLQYPAA